MIISNYEIRFSAAMHDRYRPRDQLDYKEFDEILEAIAYIEKQEKNRYNIWTLEVIDFDRIKEADKT